MVGLSVQERCLGGILFMDLDVIFSGVGTSLIIFLLGIIFGVGGHKLYISNRNNQIIKTPVKGNENKIINSNGGNNNQSASGNIVNNNYNGAAGYDITRLNSYSNKKIMEAIEITNDNENLRKWCLELISEKKADFLIKVCIDKMNNNAEKYNLISELAKRKQTESEYFNLVVSSIDSDRYRAKTIELLVSAGNKNELLRDIFIKMTNNVEKEKSLYIIFDYNQDLFIELYDNSACLTNKTYKDRVEKWLETK